jgi:glycosyltransferase involved in cell wall biosynthesis
MSRLGRVSTAAANVMGRRSGRRVAFVVNSPFMQERANALAANLGDGVETMVADGARGEAVAAIRASDLVYVIDAGRRGSGAALAGRLRRKTVVVELGDPQGELYQAQQRRRPAVWTGRLLDRVVTTHADGVAVRGRRLAEILGVRVPWVEITDGVDVGVFRPVADDGLRRGLGIPDDVLVAGLAGTIRPQRRPGLGYGWDLVEMLAELRDEPVWGLVVGGGPALPALRRRAVELGVADRLVTPGAVSRAEMPRFLAAMDVCISTQTNDAIGRSRTTAKLPEYAACDRYILATEVGGAADVLPAEMLLPYDGSYDPGYPVRLARRIAELAPRRLELRRGGGTRPIALERYSYPKLGRRLGAFLESVGR